MRSRSTRSRRNRETQSCARVATRRAEPRLILEAINVADTAWKATLSVELWSFLYLSVPHTFFLDNAALVTFNHSEWMERARVHMCRAIAFVQGASVRGASSRWYIRLPEQLGANFVSTKMSKRRRFPRKWRASEKSTICLYIAN